MHNPVKYRKIMVTIVQQAAFCSLCDQGKSFQTISEFIVDHWIISLKNRWVTFVTVTSFEPIYFRHLAKGHNVQYRHQIMRVMNTLLFSSPFTYHGHSYNHRIWILYLSHHHLLTIQFYQCEKDMMISPPCTHDYGMNLFEWAIILQHQNWEMVSK